MRNILKLSVFFALLVALSGCGTLTITNATKTVTASPSPSASPETSASPHLTAEEQSGLAVFVTLTEQLQQMFTDEVKAMNYAGDTGDAVGFVHLAKHYSAEWVVISHTYNSSNGGEFYGGNLHRLETFYEDVAEHVRKFGINLIRIVTTGSQSAIYGTAQQRVWAESGFQHLRAELERLQGLSESTY